MNELIVNLHMHTVYSDGDGSHQDILNAAIKSGIDVAIVTDHNTLVGGVEQYFKSGNHKGLLLVGEEIHNQDRQPQNPTCWFSMPIRSLPNLHLIHRHWSIG